MKMAKNDYPKYWGYSFMCENLCEQIKWRYDEFDVKLSKEFKSLQTNLWAVYNNFD